MLAGLQKPLDTGKPFLVFADEFSFYHTETLTQILRLGRAYRIGLILSHQNVEDVPQDLQAAAFGNVASMVAFRVGSTYAKILATNFGGKIEGNKFIETPLYKTYTKIETNVFTMETLPPPDTDMGQSQLIIDRSRQVLSVKKKPEPSIEEAIEEDWVWWDDKETTKVKLLDVLEP